MRKKRTALLSLVLSLPLSTFAWGGLGHQTMAVIAESRLTPQAKASVKELLDGQRLSDVATWADSVRGSSSYSQTSWYHFEKIADDTRFLDHLRGLQSWQVEKGGVVEAILVAEKTLVEDRAPAKEQTDALKFLVHFVGDVHQPLHSGRPDDNGGVKIQVNWFGEVMSLHAVWDSGLIRTGHPELFLNSKVNSSTAIAVRYAQDLTQRLSGLKISTDPDVEGWLNESMALRKAIYDPLYLKDQNEYQKLHLPEVDLRVYSSGLRLAEVLNSIFSKSPAASKDDLLWKEVEEIVGDLFRLISFRP